MATDYTEKRNFFRMNLDCKLEYSINGDATKKTGIVSNLSGDGISFMSDQNVAPGTHIHVLITPDNTVTPPLDMTVEVTRCDEESEDQYQVAAIIVKR